MSRERGRGVDVTLWAVTYEDERGRRRVLEGERPDIVEVYATRELAREVAKLARGRDEEIGCWTAIRVERLEMTP